MPDADRRERVLLLLPDEADVLELSSATKVANPLDWLKEIGHEIDA
jgi:hypothetical protein